MSKLQIRQVGEYYQLFQPMILGVRDLILLEGLSKEEAKKMLIQAQDSYDTLHDLLNTIDYDKKYNNLVKEIYPLLKGRL